MAQPAPQTEFDAAWKASLELFFESFVQFCFPALHRLVDWNEAAVFLDAELQQIALPRRRGRRTADKLVRVQLLDGTEEWILVHVEVQSQRDRDFAERMWIYYRRISDRYERPVVSLAVLADDQRTWKPDSFATALAGCELHFRFPVFKVIECQRPEDEFARSRNPFALIVAAHQAALATRRDAGQRCAERLRLVRTLSQHGTSRENAILLLRLISSLTTLPPDQETRFQEEVLQTGVMEMGLTINQVISSFDVALLERFNQQNRIEALRLTLMDVLEARFGKVPAKIKRKIEKIDDEARLRQAHRLAVTAATLDEFAEKA